jgi:YHS domain-containing protein
MKTRSIPAIALATVLTCATGYSLAQDQLTGRQAKNSGQTRTGAREKNMRPALPPCPVTGEPIDFSVRTMTEDGPVYFCCPDCIPKFEKDPAKYTEKIAAQRAALKKLERVQVTCPVMGNPIDGRSFVSIYGQDADFCCQYCPPRYLKDPAKYKAKLEASYTYQTRCPVSGEKINPTAFVDLAGQRIYLCCKGCSEKLTKDPAKYAPKLAEQGVKLDLKKLAGQPERKEDQHTHDHDEHGSLAHP